VSSTRSSSAAFGSSLYTRPVANAGPNQTVKEQDVVTLTALGSTQAQGNPLTYQWTQTEGPTVILSDDTAAQPTFTAPSGNAVIKFTVIATDTVNPTAGNGTGGKVSPASAPVTITVNPYATPIANAGPDQSDIDPDQIVTLDGSGSSQSDNLTLSYEWTQTDGDPVVLSDPHAVNPTFTAPTGPTTLRFSLVVSDAFHTSLPDEVSISVNGIEGLDLQGVITSGDIKGHLESSTFKLTVTNVGTKNQTVTQDDVSLSAMLNGDPVSASQFTVDAKSALLKPGKNTVFTLRWNHTSATLSAGDLIDVAGCVNVLGDSVPENDCGHVISPTSPVDYSADSFIGVVRKSSDQNAVKVTVTNNGTSTIGPLRLSQILLSVQVDGEDVGTLTPPAAEVSAALAPGAAKTYSFKWAHPRLSVGTEITITGCVAVQNNTSGSSCSIIQATVVT
jgi:hypothetical protein